MIRHTLFAVLLVVSAGSGHAQRSQAAAPAATEQRVALVIGNAAYATAPLANPVNDASDIASALQAAGFKVILKRNASTREMRQAIRDFGIELRRAQVGLFYFAGHGLQVKGNNYLVPVGAEIESEADAEDLAIDANYALRTMEEAQVKVSIVILDACRNAPFSRGMRSSSRGLAQMTAATGSLVAFATAPGSVAGDGTGRNGTYTKHLLASLREADTDVLKVFQRTRAAVVKETEGKQTPWESTSLTGDFHFRAQTGAAPSAMAVLTPSHSSAQAEYSANERTFWESVKDSKEPGELRAYLDKFPSGLFATLAQSRLKALQAAAPSTASAPTDRASARQQAELGQQYFTGQGGLTKDDTQAVRLFRIAASQGDAYGQAGLGWMYANGLGGVPKDEAEAVRLYRLSANQGFASGQVQLGSMHEAGKSGLERDHAEAVRLYKQATDQGHARGQSSLGFMHLNGLGGLAKNEAEAARLFKLAAMQGDSRGQNSLGWMHANGLGELKKDDTEAVRLYRLAADQGHPVAQANLGVMYENGRGGLARDVEMAVHWYKLAAKSAQTTAVTNLLRLGRL